MKNRIFALLSLLIFSASAWPSVTDKTRDGRTSYEEFHDVFTGDMQKYSSWHAFELSVQKENFRDSNDGLSYILSGSLAVIAGFAGQGVSSDPLEKGVYTLFQSIGIAAIGYGSYSLMVGNDDKLLYSALEGQPNMSLHERTEFLRNYGRLKRERERKERIVKAITHGMIAALNIYTATQQKPGPVQNALYFIGGVNVLATISYSF